jgi:hypothetical protein
VVKVTQNGKLDDIDLSKQHMFNRARQRALLRTASKEFDLTPGQKDMITKYAFIMLCDSCEANAQALFGKQFASEEIQIEFIHQAILALKREGFIK